ncbi:uncharacterized protein LOC123412484 [Hordeum vulgare subsp. vulgare]|uniref:uncharacterized protein LOC123412484 n=1 Tax=Hordeum vulgare subsp. vulgare TaxID=112509 RepID=UPI001D1A507A|nr:uncharacterized protein LOC123412484 [Hordeum vulgare subsp. vulgare]
MVSWNDNDSSDDFAAEYISHADHLSRLIPGTIEDPNYAGVDDDLMMMCEHGKSVEKLAAFEGISTGRRFLACSLDQASSCDIVRWVDEEWPEHLQNALHKLWLMYEQSKHDNRMACLDHSTIIYEKLVEDVNNLLNSHDYLPQPSHQKDVENIIISMDNNIAKDAEITKLKADVDQLKFIHVAQGNCIRNMKHNHLKENENMSTDNRTLKFCWADLKKEKEKLDGCIAELMKDKEKWSIEKSAIECCIANLKKACENNNMKLKKIKCICDEE